MFWAIDKAGDKFVFGSIDDLFDFIAIRGEENIVQGWAGVQV
jgi:hypothetical protein